MMPLKLDFILTGDHSFNDLLAYLRKIVDDPKYNLSAPVENRTVLRVALCSLGTASWLGDIVKFLINLRLLIRNSCVTCLITVPTCLFQVGNYNETLECTIFFYIWFKYYYVVFCFFRNICCIVVSIFVTL